MSLLRFQIFINVLCFQYSVALSKYREKGSNYKKINEIKLFVQHFNFEDINHPLKKKEYETLEKNNESISLIVFKPDNERKKRITILNQNTL